MIVLVYGDGKRIVDPRELLRALAGQAHAARPEQRTASLIDAGELAQGLIDSEFETARIDDATPLTAAATALLGEVAAWFVVDGDRPLALERQPLPSLPARVSVSRPEGFAFYAVYPSAYASAARRFLSARTRVIGIRSIGLTLAAVVAATLGSERLVSVRPIGHPFDRTLAIGPGLERMLLDDRGDAIYLIVDEGPGLSGSSLASVAGYLLDRGVSHDRVVLMPSHPGEPGPHGSDRVRRIWRTIERIVPAPAPALESLASAGTDLGGGAWRRVVYGDHPWPPANPQQERQKFLVDRGGRLRLAKFAGLGRYGADKLALAQMLASRGWTTRVVELTDGFLLGEWRSDAVPLDHPDAIFDRATLLRRVGEYIDFRGRTLPADECAGATIEQLLDMIMINAEQALGSGEPFSPWHRRLPELAAGLRPCKTDNRMHRFEWLVTRDGTILKADAVDHHAAHDLIGAQDPLWDLVGARHELSLDDREFAALRQQLGRRWTDLQVEFFSAAYLAFACGAATLAARTAAEPDATSLRREARRYAAALRSIAPSAR